MIKSLKLKNFQKHEDLSIEFSDGLNMIVGQNWAGKTTIQRAILYALFGSTATNVKSKDLTTNGKSGMSVELEFGDYRVVRGASKASLFFNDELIATGQTTVTREIENVLGLTAKNFLNFRTVMQNEAGALLSLGSRKLEEFLNEIAEVDVIDSVLVKSREEKKRLSVYLEREEELKQKELDRKEAVSKLNSEIASLLTELETAQNNKKLAEAAVESRKKEYNVLVEQAREAEESKRKIYLLQQTKKALETQTSFKDEISANISKLQKDLMDAELVLNTATRCLEDKRTEMEARKKEIEDWYLAYNEHTKNLTQYDQLANRLRVCEDHIKQNKAYVDTYKEACDRGAEIASLENESINLRSSVETLNKEIESLKTAIKSGICQECNRPYEDSFDKSILEKQVAEKEGNKKHLEEEFNDNQVEITTLQAETSTHKNRLSAEANLITLEKQRYEITELLSELNGSKDFPEKPIEISDSDEQEAVQKTSRKVFELKLNLSNERDKQAKLQEALTKLGQVTQQLAELGPEPLVPDTQAALRTRDEAVSILHQWENYLSRTQESLSGLQGTLRSHEQEQGRLSDELAALSAHRARQELLKRLEQFISKNRDAFTSELWTGLLSLATGFISRTTDGDLSSLVRTEDGFAYVEQGAHMPVELASGMQQAILGTGFKLALGQAMGGLAPFMLLDEVTAAGSEETSMKVVEEVGKMNQQIIFFTHRDTDTVFANTVIELG